MILDLIAALIISYGFYRGFSNGLIDTFVDVFSILAGLVIAFKFSPLLISYIQDVVSVGDEIGFILGFLICFFAVVFILRFIGDRMEGILKATKVNFINQIAGGAVLAFVFAFFIGLLFIFLSDLNIINKSYADQSTLYNFLVSVAEDGGWIMDGFKKIFSEFWAKFSETINAVEAKVKEN